MKNILGKIVIAVALMLSMLLMPTGAEAAIKNPFKDISKNSPYMEIIHEMRDKNIISGYANGEFRPNESINRKHAAALVNRAVKLPARNKYVEFKDVSTKNPYFNDIKKLQQAGIFEADNKGNLYPNKAITRAEMAKVLTIAFDLKVQTELDFPDVPKTHPANKYVRAIYSNAITTGDNGKFLPNKPVTRAHYAVFLHRTLHMNDPIDPAEPAKPLRGQLAGISEEYLQYAPNQIAHYMRVMLNQKVSRYPSDYLLTNSIKNGPYGDKREIEMYDAGMLLGQMAKENILYLKRFVKADSDLEHMLNRWEAGDFSTVKEDYIVLVETADPEYFVWCDEDKCLGMDNLHIRTKRAEEFYLSTVHGQKGVDLHRKQWGMKMEETTDQLPTKVALRDSSPAIQSIVLSTMAGEKLMDNVPFRVENHVASIQIDKPGQYIATIKMKNGEVVRYGIEAKKRDDRSTMDVYTVKEKKTASYEEMASYKGAYTIREKTAAQIADVNGSRSAKGLRLGITGKKAGTFHIDYDNVLRETYCNELDCASEWSGIVVEVKQIGSIVNVFVRRDVAH